MKENIERALTVVFGAEGGLSLRKDDKGNWTGGKVGKGFLRGTKYGISAAAYPDLDIGRLTLADAAALYRRDYWARVGGDALPAGVDLCVFDAAVNSGVSQAKVWNAATYDDHPTARIHAFCAKRLSFLHGIKLWRTYGTGWAARVAKIEATAVAWATAAAGVVTPKAKLQAEAQKAEQTRDDAHAAGRAAGATVAASGVAAPVLDHEAVVYLALGMLIMGALALYAWHVAHVNKARAAAFADAAQEN